MQARASVGSAVLSTVLSITTTRRLRQRTTRIWRLRGWPPGHRVDPIDGPAGPVSRVGVRWAMGRSSFVAANIR